VGFWSLNMSDIGVGYVLFLGDGPESLGTVRV
jgi:hypothetical protein